jgi:hypothetical protein
VKNNACVSSCDSKTQYYDSSTGACANSDTTNCGQKGYKCVEHLSNWKTGVCTNNACVVQTCNDGYAPINNECKADCGTTKYYDSTTGACVDSDVNNCGQKGFKCSQNVTNWSNGTCSNNVCIVTSCDSGFKPSSDGKSCVSNCSNTQYYDSEQAKCVNSTLDNCGQKGYKCSDKILNWDGGTCSNNVCTVNSCKSGYTVKNNACVSSCNGETQYYDSSTGACANSSVTDCGQKGYKCSEHISNWSKGACTGNACIVSECASGYAVVGNECKANCGTTQYYDSSSGACATSNENNCGQKGYACSNLAGWSSGNCTNNQCVATNCTSGYHNSEGKCIADTVDCCGTGCAKCNVANAKNFCDGSCDYKCNAEFVDTGTACVKCTSTNVSYCGGYSCNTDNTCKTSCSDNNDCASGYECNSENACVEIS